MKLLFNRAMAQRYRCLLHVIDPIIERGHDLFAVVSKHSSIDYYSRYRDTPCDIDKSCPDLLLELAHNFGIKPRRWSQVEYTTDKKEPCDLHLCFDDHNSGCFGLPYNEPYVVLPKGDKVYVGFPIAEAIRDRMETVEEIPGSVLIIHPGGGRGYVSPQRRQIAKSLVDESNRLFIQEILDALPNTKLFTIKSHPFPYRRCTAADIKEHVVHKLSTMATVRVADADLVGLIASHEYILNWGGTTGLWLKDTGKKWCNIRGMNYHGAKREKLIDERGGGCPLSDIKWKCSRDDRPIVNLIMEYLDQTISRLPS